MLSAIINNLPEVKGPVQKKVPFKEKIKWTLLILSIFYILGEIPLFGLGPTAIEQFEYISIILGANFGAITSLGIGPIVTASIVLQLLNGSGIFNFDLETPEGKEKFQGFQKLLSIFFIVFESLIYVLMGGLAPDSIYIGTSVYRPLQMIIIFQLFLGGTLVLFMDEVISKWGFGSGISLFIAAGVSKRIFLQTFNPLHSQFNPNIPAGALPALFKSLALGDATTAGLKFAAIIATIIVFIIAVYTQAMKVEIPLSFGRVRGHGIRWPLNFIYTSNIPVILIAALLANIQLLARLVQKPWITALTGWMRAPPIVKHIIQGSFSGLDIAKAFVYMIIMIIGSVIFSIFWVQTSGMDSKSQAKQIMDSGLQVPGFRKDKRILERLLDRYIPPLTVMGAIAIGLLAGLADLTGAMGSGTGILLTVMIIYKLYEEITKEHMMDMNPMMRKFMQ